MYHEGKGVPQDSREALKWYRLAADQGDPAAQFSLGLMYDRGNGVPQNYVQAYMWYSLAATSGSAKGPNHRDLILGGHPKAAIRGHFKTGHREGGKTTTFIAQPRSAEQG
jgi:TPR repeat protein